MKIFYWKIPVVARITAGLIGLLVSVLMFVSLLGLFPDSRAELLNNRITSCESAAISVALMAERTNVETIRIYLESLAKRNPDIQSLGVRRCDGSLVVEVGDHVSKWDSPDSDAVSESQVWIQFFAGKEPWGTFEAAFTPPPDNRLLALSQRPELRHGMTAVVMCLIAFHIYLRVVLRHLDPSQAIPRRVREALDTLAEGLLILDRKDRIVLANRAFETATGTALSKILGSSVDKIPFVNKEDTESDRTPWREADESGNTVTGRLLGVNLPGFENRTFSVSASPIKDDQGNQRGVLASFEDVTNLEQKKRELTDMVQYLRASSEAIKQQNRELEHLASRDPLTGCLNRRAFFEKFDGQWNTAVRYEQPISVLMIDIDHFKSINDGYGHKAGDEVLRKVGATLRDQAREADLVCRFGGEEFLVCLPMTDGAEAEVVAERIRESIESLPLPQSSITASIGAVTRSVDTDSLEVLLDRADKALYAAKHGGRNQVMTWEDVPEDSQIGESKSEFTKEEVNEPVSIPYQAVTALMSGLAYRDHSTASHSRRVADLCVAVAEGLMSLTDCYTLEVAALLHDIGKIGVPDHILLKPGKLTEEEWKVMRRHDIMGIEIIRSSFASPKLTETVEYHQAQYGYSATSPNAPSGNRIPLGSRILAIADAYDSMTSDQVFRDGCSMDEAFAELRRCAGSQFDPELVERFISTVRGARAVQQIASIEMSKETALAVGLQIEQLVKVLDDQDYDALDAVSFRLQSTAQRYGADEVGEKAAELGVILGLDRDPHSIIQVANELLDLCRATQMSFFNAQMENDAPASDVKSESSNTAPSF